MLLSVVIPTCNRYEALQQCLRQLGPAMQGPGAGEYEIIVTDDGAGDALRDKLAADFPAIHWVRGPRRGPAANRNAGARMARGEWLIFLDDDCLPAPNLLATYMRIIAASPQREVIEGGIFPDRPQQRMDEECPINDTGQVLWSCNFAIRRALFARLGGFCEAFPYAALEDVDLRLRLKKSGITFDFHPEARVTHPWRLMPPLARIMPVRLKSHAILFAFHPEMRPTLVEIVRGLVGSIGTLWREGRQMHFCGAPRWLLHTTASHVCSLYFKFMPATPAEPPRALQE